MLTLLYCCDCILQLPKRNFATAEIVVKVSLKNHVQLLSKRTAPDYHHVTLIIGNTDNSVIFLQKLMWEGRHSDVKTFAFLLFKNNERLEVITKMHLFLLFSGTVCSWGVEAGREKWRWQRAQKDTRLTSTSSAQNMVTHNKPPIHTTIWTNTNSEACLLKKVALQPNSATDFLL